MARLPRVSLVNILQPIIQPNKALYLTAQTCYAGFKNKVNSSGAKQTF